MLQFNIVFTVNFILSLFRLILQIEDLHVPCVEWEDGTAPLHFYTRRPKPKEEASMDVGQTFRFGFPPPRELADPFFLCMSYLWLFRLIKKSLENESRG